MRGLKGSGRPRTEISEKTGILKQWNGKYWGFFKRLMIAAFEDEELDVIARGDIDRSTLQTDGARRTHDKLQMKLKRRILSSLSADVAPRAYDMGTGTEKWAYLLSYFDGKQNAKTESINMSIMYDKLQSARLKSGSDIEGHMSYMFNLRERLVTLGAMVDD